jgi:iron complex outermembrane receptor protein
MRKSLLSPLLRCKYIKVNIGDALWYVPNVATRTENHQPTTLLIRGFINNATYMDSFYVFEADIDLAAVAQIEIIKGPASATFGRGERGGAVNYVLKVPLSTTRQSLDLTVGSYDFYRATADTTGPLIRDKSMRYRFIATWEDSGSWQELSHTRKR